VLTASYQLLYGKSEDQSPINCIYLDRETVVATSPSEDKRYSKCCFQLSKKGQTRIYFLRAETREDRDEWIKLIQEQIKHRQSQPVVPNLNTVVSSDGSVLAQSVQNRSNTKSQQDSSIYASFPSTPNKTNHQNLKDVQTPNHYTEFASSEEQDINSAPSKPAPVPQVVKLQIPPTTSTTSLSNSIRNGNGERTNVQDNQNGRNKEQQQQQQRMPPSAYSSGTQSNYPPPPPSNSTNIPPSSYMKHSGLLNNNDNDYAEIDLNGVNGKENQETTPTYSLNTVDQLLQSTVPATVHNNHVNHSKDDYGDLKAFYELNGEEGKALKQLATNLPKTYSRTAAADYGALPDIIEEPKK